MSLYTDLIRPILFRVDPERAHNMGLWAISKGWVRPEQTADLAGLERTFFGVTFPNPVGLAAGFDKNGECIDRWKALGFGFVELGTVTRHAQPGNPKPRMFRLPRERAVINRLGFNNEGADAMARHLERANPGIPVGINIGKSKITELDEAESDYAYSFKVLRPFADYMVVNVSSPNTPGLRTLQDKEPLARILGTLRDIDSGKPLFVKIAPDLEEAQIDDVAELAQQFGLTGVVATNTTVARTGLAKDPGIEGGLSGAPLRDRADEVLTHIAQRLPDRVHIGVGGIMSGEDAHRKLSSGASLVQVYTGWVYAGPSLPDDLCRFLAAKGLPGPA